MVKQTVLVKMKNGLHARPAALLVQLVSKFESDIKCITEKNKFDAKSIISLMSSGIRENDEITIEVNGSDENEAIKNISDFFSTQN